MSFSDELKDLSLQDRQAVEEFQQFLRWAGPVGTPGPHILLAQHWYYGLLTIEEGQRIEHGQQIWQVEMVSEVSA